MLHFGVNKKLRDERLSQWRLLSLGGTFKVSFFESFAAIRLYNFNMNPSFTRGGGSSRPPKSFSSITFEQNKLETSNFA